MTLLENCATQTKPRRTFGQPRLQLGQAACFQTRTKIKSFPKKFSLFLFCLLFQMAYKFTVCYDESLPRNPHPLHLGLVLAVGSPVTPKLFPTYSLRLLEALVCISNGLKSILRPHILPFPGSYSHAGIFPCNVPRQFLAHPLVLTGRYSPEKLPVVYK